jgi:hypothetical protein
LLTFDVSGRLELVGSTAASGSPLATPPPLSVRTGGQAVLLDSLVITQTTATNAGRLVAVRSSIVLIFNGSIPVLDTTELGTSYLLASSLQRMPNATVTDPICSGTPPVSLGYVHLDVACGGTATPTDTSGPAGVDPFKGTSDWFDPASPLIDAIPAGSDACRLPLVDRDGSVRGTDGDGDGIGACDVGAFEFQPAT